MNVGMGSVDGYTCTFLMHRGQCSGVTDGMLGLHVRTCGQDRHVAAHFGARCVRILWGIEGETVSCALIEVSL